MNRLVEAFSTTTKSGGDSKGKGKKTYSHVYKFDTREVAEEKPLSEGGFAYVSLMKDVHTSRPYAMKKMKCTDRTRYQMALHECKILESLAGHPNIVNCYGHITEPGEQVGSKDVCLLLDYCDGGHLLDLLDRHHGRLPTATIVKAMKDLMSAVSILHTQSPPIQHRDLKVENVLYNTASDLYTLCDFGSATTREYPNPSSLSKAQMATLEEDIQRYTTLMYRSPEMVDLYTGLPITTKSDIWMCGCILFTLICYRHPFQDQSVLAISNARYEIDPEAAERHPRPLTQLCTDAFSDARSPNVQQPLPVREGKKMSKHQKRRPKSLEPPPVLPSPESSGDEGREIHSAPDWSTPSDSELPSWRAFQTEESQQQQQEVVESNPRDAWKSFSDPNPLRELPEGAAVDSASRTLASTAPPAAAWGATFGSSSGVEAMPSPTVPGDGLPEWTAFGGTVSPSSPQPLASSMPPPPTDTSQFTTGNDVWGDGPSAAVDNGRSGRWEAFNSDAPPKAEDQTLASPLVRANRVSTTTTDLITLNDDRPGCHAGEAHTSLNQDSQRGCGDDAKNSRVIQFSSQGVVIGHVMSLLQLVFLARV
ncbi:hypothetical protein FOZ62_001509 [Perkinsus olseni]|uniref:non-specific serine/threonine protein kinase n=1 Tax=Perkinsus olseni TaxID=32597 RepID=A0A7J6RWF7_PEROL|nr:hypothetical protein FOZ62_001509 [Perkinsus olseni]